MRNGYPSPAGVAELADALDSKSSHSQECVGSNPSAGTPAFPREMKLESLRENLTNMIVHDLRGPLPTTMGFLQVLSSLLDVNRLSPERCR